MRLAAFADLLQVNGISTAAGDGIVQTIRVSGDSYEIVWGPNATQQHQDAAAAMLATFDKDDLAADKKSAAKNVIDAADTEYLARAIIAVALLSKDEVNILRQWLVSFKDAVANANTLAALKTAVAGLPNLPDRGVAQMKTAAKNIIDANGNE